MGKKISESPIALLSQKIEAVLRAGITLDNAVVDYIESTFSNPTMDELTETITDSSSGEAESLLELLFFPDEDIQLQLEGVLDQTEFQPEDQQEVLDNLLSCNLEIPLHFADQRETLTVALPPAAAVQFVNRLNITKTLDQRLKQAIASSDFHRWGDAAKVRLRNARQEFSENAIEFLCRFFQKMRGSRRDLFKCLEVSLALFDEQPDAADIFKALMAKKRFYLKSYHIALKHEKLLKTHNMETLLLQGVRLSYIHKDDALSAIRSIDRISRTVFGATDHSGEMMEASLVRQDLDAVSPGEDMEEVVKMFT